MALDVKECLKELRLPAMRACYEELAEQVHRNGFRNEQCLGALPAPEREERRQNRIERLLRASKLPLEKNLDSFDRTRLPRKVDGRLSVLVERSFLDRAENVLAFGNPGGRKTHLLCALGPTDGRKRRCLWCLGGWGSTYPARLSFGVLRVGTDPPGRAGGRQ